MSYETKKALGFFERIKYIFLENIRFVVFKCEATANSVTGHVCVYSKNLSFIVVRVVIEF